MSESLRARRVAESFRQPQLVGFALLAAVAPWISIFVPRVMAGVLPVMALLAVAGTIWVRRRLPYMDGDLCLIAAGFVLLCAMSAIWAPDAQDVLKTTGHLGGAFAAGLFLFFAADELNEEERRRLSALLLGGFLFALLVMTVDRLSGLSISRLVASERALADISSMSNRGIVVMSVLLWPVVSVVERLGAGRLVPLLIAVTFVVSLFTESQTAWFTVLVAGGTYFLVRSVPRMGSDIIEWGGAFFILGLPWAVLVLRAYDPHIDFDWKAASVGARLEIWYAVAAEIAHAPLIGHGIDAARFVKHWDMANIYYPFKTILHPHNGVLQVWYELGVLGAFALAAIWFGLARRLQKMFAPAASFAAIVAILIVSSISHGLWQSWWLGAVGILPALFQMAGPGAHREPASETNRSVRKMRGE